MLASCLTILWLPSCQEPKQIEDSGRVHDSSSDGVIRDGVWQLEIISQENNCDNLEEFWFSEMVVFREFFSMDNYGKMYLSSSGDEIVSYHFSYWNSVYQYDVVDGLLELSEIVEFNIDECSDGDLIKTQTTSLSVSVVSYEEMLFDGYETVLFAPDECQGILEDCRYEGVLRATWIEELPFEVDE